MLNKELLIPLVTDRISWFGFMGCGHKSMDSAWLEWAGLLLILSWLKTTGVVRNQMSADVAPSGEETDSKDDPVWNSQRTELSMDYRESLELFCIKMMSWT